MNIEIANKATGKRFMPSAGNTLIKAICPANSGLAYAVTKSGQYALIDCPTCTNVAGLILSVSTNFADIQAAFYTEQSNRRV